MIVPYKRQAIGHTSRVKFTIDWVDALSEGDLPVSATWSAPKGAIVSGDLTGTLATVTFDATGSQVGDTIPLTCRITTKTKQEDERTIVLSAIDR